MPNITASEYTRLKSDSEKLQALKLHTVATPAGNEIAKLLAIHYLYNKIDYPPGLLEQVRRKLPVSFDAWQKLRSSETLEK
jgi:hypothetical protein